MKLTSIISIQAIKPILLIASIVSFSVISQGALADDSVKSRYDSVIKQMNYSPSMRIKGVLVGKGIYFGQAKVAGKSGLGFIVDRKTYAWGVNNKGISITKRF